MPSHFVLAIINTMFLPSEFATVAVRARESGYRVLEYTDNAAFFAATDDHAQIDALLCMGSTPIGAEMLARMPRLRAGLSAVTGVEGFDIPAATACSVLIGNGQTELNYIGMAESTILMILAALYDFNCTQDKLRRNGPRPSPLRARLLRGRRVGFIGFGRIAQEVAARLAPFGVTMSAYVHRPKAEMAALGVAPAGLEAVIAGADILSLHCALNAQTHHIINAARLALMKPGAILINTSRGALVDEPALIAALAAGRIAGAALDTFETEPLPMDSPLRTFENVILTPHMIGHTDECNRTLMETAWASISNVAKGEPPVFIKNPEALATWRRRVPAETLSQS
jgi:phosphoglycerate dehydrogenase-like enzyme